MKGTFLVVAAVIAAGVAVGAVQAMQQPSAPAPTEDRIGFPTGWDTTFTVLYVFDRPDNKQVRVISGNEAAASAKPNEPFPYGSVIVMATYRAVLDDKEQPVLDDNGRFQKGELTALFVMKKERGFGEAYGPNRNGEWEYVAYRPDGSYQTMPQNTASCAICHGDTKGARDWTFRTDLYFKSASGAAPQGTILNYTFLPDTITVKAGSTVTWYNADVQTHTVSSAGGGGWDSGRLLYGMSFAQRFDTPGVYEFQCNIHPAFMKGRVVVE